MNSSLGGLGKKGRGQLATVIKRCAGVITVSGAAAALSVPPDKASQLLSGWSASGWLSRVKRGVYVPVPLQSSTSEVMVDEPWLIAKAIFHPCYIGGWTAAEHWDLTEQIFNSVFVFTTKKVHKRELSLKGVRFHIKTISPNRLFGIEEEWIQNQKVPISDATRTVIDIMNDPATVGGIRMAADVLTRYLNSKHKNVPLLCKYGEKIGNRTLFKRLGFLLERIAPSETQLIDSCYRQITKGYSQLDPSIPGKKLSTHWRLWVPASWLEKVPA